jgi:hypothetical protein
MSPLRTLANLYGQVQRTRGSAERTVEFLAVQPEPSDQCDIELRDPTGRPAWHWQTGWLSWLRRTPGHDSSTASPGRLYWTAAYLETDKDIFELWIW